MLSYMFFMYSFEILSILGGQTSRIGGERTIKSPMATGLIITGAVWVKHLYHVHNKSQTINFEYEAVLLWKTIYMLCSKVTPKTVVTLDKVQQKIFQNATIS